MAEQENSGRFKRVVLLKAIPAYYFDKQGSLSVKGGFGAGKLLKVDTQTIIKKDGFSLYLVKNVKHDSVYVNLEKGNYTPLKVSEALKQSGDVNAIKKAMAIIIAKTEVPKSNSDGLSYYEDKAFDCGDGFCFVHDSGEPSSLQKKAIAIKEKLSKPAEIKEKVKKYDDGMRKRFRGTGNGSAFN